MAFLIHIAPEIIKFSQNKLDEVQNFALEVRESSVKFTEKANEICNYGLSTVIFF